MPTPNFDFLAILETFTRHGVEFIVVGGVCAVLHGAPLSTFDLDIVHSRTAQNVNRLLAALKDLDADYREQPARRLTPRSSHLMSTGHNLLTTRFGHLDVLGTIGAGHGYEDLVLRTTDLELTEGLKVRLLDLASL